VKEITTKCADEIAMLDAFDFCDCKGHKKDWLRDYSKTERDRRVRRVKLILKEVGIEVISK
jgi:hypothetical protein